MHRMIPQLLLVAEIELPELEWKSVQNQKNTKKIRFFAPMIFQWVSHPVSEIIRNQCYF